MEIMTGNVTVAKAAGIATITLDAPPFNLVSRTMTRALDQALDRCDADPSIRVVIIAGAGDRAFCGGSDIKEFPALMKPRASIENKLALENAVYTKLAHFRAPTIAAIDGLALGGGLELAVCCDFIIVEDGVPLGLPETKLGIFPGSGGTVRVTRRIGAARAKQMMYLGELLPTATALDWGLVDRVVAKGRAREESMKLAASLAAGSANGIRLAKIAIDSSLEKSEPDALREVLELMDQAFCARDAGEGVSAFLEKRKPRFD
jgi:enoyl-CoA hydratase/carnithine racemase